MSEINVNTTVLKQIQTKISNLWSVADRGFDSCSQALEGTNRQMSDFCGQVQSKISLLNSDADRLERTADAEQFEYDRQVKEVEAGRSNSLPYYSPDMKRDDAVTKRKQAKELEAVLAELLQECRMFKGVQEKFIVEFRKIAKGGGGAGDKDQLERELTKSIELLSKLES